MFAAFQIPLSWSELLKRTAKESSEDDILGLAAQLAYYFFLALFPAVLFILALASFFPLTNFIDDIVRALRPIAPADVLAFLAEQLRRISNTDSSGILTIGILGAIWSSSAAVVARRVDRVRGPAGDYRGYGPHPDRHRPSTLGSGARGRRARGWYRLFAHSLWARRSQAAGIDAPKDD
jgi:Virulence factor BrkB